MTLLFLACHSELPESLPLPHSLARTQPLPFANPVRAESFGKHSQHKGTALSSWQLWQKLEAYCTALVLLAAIKSDACFGQCVGEGRHVHHAMNVLGARMQSNITKEHGGQLLSTPLPLASFSLLKLLFGTVGA